MTKNIISVLAIISTLFFSGCADKNSTSNHSFFGLSGKEDISSTDMDTKITCAQYAMNPEKHPESKKKCTGLAKNQYNNFITDNLTWK